MNRVMAPSLTLIPRRVSPGEAGQQCNRHRRSQAHDGHGHAVIAAQVGREQGLQHLIR